MKKAKKVLAVFINILLVILILIGIIVGVSLLPIKNNYKILTVMSGSMAPKIKTGTLIMVRPASDYSQDDIVTFRPLDAKKNNDTVTHRILEVKENNGVKTYLTKGDANNAPDANEVPKNRIVGKYLFGIPVLGYVVGYVKTLPGLILLVIIPATIIVLEESKKIIKEIKKIRRKKAQEQALKNQEAK